MKRLDSVQEQVYLQLQDEIIHMERLPGTTMSVYDVSDQMGVSRTPVREAFIRLAAESLVEITPQRKTRISRIDFSRVRQERFLRTALELAATERFLEIATAECFVRMREIIARQCEAVRQGDPKRLLAYDDAFHGVIFEVVRQQLSWNIIHDMSGHERRVRMMMVCDSGDAQSVISEHKALLDAFEAGDAARAMQCCGEHLEKLIAQEDVLRRQYPDYFSEKMEKAPQSSGIIT